jgi:SAM-dependent methyltransferase
MSRPVLALALKGDKFTDPIDGKSFKTFCLMAMERKETMSYHHTLSLERHRLLWLFLNEESDFFTSTVKKVLHFAPEQAFYKLFRNQKNLDYTTTDLLSFGRCKADICDLPFEDNQYDVILCNHVLEHIPDDTKAMQELYRVLKPGGMAILQIPQELSRAVTFLMIQ